jgi:hypothetical protein
MIESGRSLARGGTYLAAYDSDEAVNLNAATLGMTNVTFQLRWAEFGLFVGKNAVDTISDIAGSAGVDGGDTAITLLKQFKDTFGKRLYGRIQGFPMGLRIGRFEISSFIASSNFIDVRTPTLPELEFISDSSGGANISYAHPIGKTLAVAMTVRPFMRTYFAGDLAFADVLTFLDSSSQELSDLIDQKQGSYIAVDIAGIWRPSKWGFGLNIENIGYSAPTNADDVEKAPPVIAQRINIGTNRRYEIGSWHLDLAADIQDLANPHKYDFFRLVHLGSEFGRSWFSRDNDVGAVVGVNEGYFGGGLYVDAYFLRAEIMNYAVELGEFAGQRMDRRYALNLRATTTF